MPSGQRVYIGNLPNDCRDRDIEKFFKGYGKISDISVKNGYGFVNFEDTRDADDACQDMDGKELLGTR
jgi:arginine/serine-rich splicing factor 4/5/6